MTTSISILLKSFVDSDLFGKGIFCSLFMLSILSWIVIGYKVYCYYMIRKKIKHDLSIFQETKEGILNLSFIQGDNLNHPFAELYERMKDKTLKILEKNQFFSKNSDQLIFLSKNDLDLISQDLASAVAYETKKIEQGLFILNTSTSLAPFLGILGTVWGILISLFEMQKGSSSFSNTIIIQGLSTALATTVIGLLIAIPALIGHSYLKSIARSIHMDMGLFCNDLMTKLELQYKRVESYGSE